MRFSSLVMKSCITAFNSIIQLLFLWLSDVFLEASCADLECCLLQSCCGLLMHNEAASSCLPALAGWLVLRELFLGRFKQVTTHPAEGVCDRSRYGSIRVQSGESMSSLAYLVNMGEELLTAAWYPCGSHSTEHAPPHSYTDGVPCQRSLYCLLHTSQGHKAAAIRGELQADGMQEDIP